MYTIMQATVETATRGKQEDNVCFLPVVRTGRELIAGEKVSFGGRVSLACWVNRLGPKEEL